MSVVSYDAAESGEKADAAVDEFFAMYIARMLPSALVPLASCETASQPRIATMVPRSNPVELATQSLGDTSVVMKRVSSSRTG